MTVKSHSEKELHITTQTWETLRESFVVTRVKGGEGRASKGSSVSLSNQTPLFCSQSIFFQLFSVGSRELT